MGAAPVVRTFGGTSAEAALVAAARGGDRRAFGLVFEQYAPMVHGILLSRVPRGEVDDLVQDVFLGAMQKLSTLRDEETFGAWLAAIARNRATDFLRTRRMTTELSDDLAQSSRREGGKSDAERILAIIRELPEAYRETLVLRLVEDMTGPEIAERVGLTKESVRVNLHRGMALLRERLGLAKEDAP